MHDSANILACPVCRSPGLRIDPPCCQACGRTFAGGQAHLNLTPVPPPDADVLSKWDLWEKLQANGVVSYEGSPEENLAVGDRRDAKAYAAFCRLDGCTVLDVGCGPQRMPSYAAGHGDRLYGVDPLPGADQRDFHFIQAIAEYLPFRDASFDRILFGTSLDHFLSPQRALKEARRTIKPDGQVCIWYGDDQAVIQPPKSAAGMIRNAFAVLKSSGWRGVWKRVRRKLGLGKPSYAANLEVPEGAVDHYHFFHVETEHLEAWLKEAGFRVEEVSREGGGHNVFVRAVPV